MPSLTPVSYRSRKNNSARNGSSECSKLALAVESGKDSDISRPSLLLPASLHLPADSLALNYRRNPYDLWRQSAAARSAAVLVVYSSSRRCVVEPESQTAKTLVLLPPSRVPFLRCRRRRIKIGQAGRTRVVREVTMRPCRGFVDEMATAAAAVHRIHAGRAGPSVVL